MKNWDSADEIGMDADKQGPMLRDSIHVRQVCERLQIKCVEVDFKKVHSNKQFHISI